MSKSVLTAILLTLTSAALAQAPPPPPMRHAPIAAHHGPVHRVKPHSEHNPWINPSQFPPNTPVLPPLPGPLPNPFNPTPAPISNPINDVTTSILQAMADAQAIISGDLQDANALASTIKPTQDQASCTGTFTPAVPAVPPVNSVIFTGAIAGTTLTVSNVMLGTLSVGQTISDTGGLIQPSTAITGPVTPGVWTVSVPQTVASETMVVVQTPGVPAVAANCNPPEVYDRLGTMCFPALQSFVTSIPGPGALPTIPQGHGGFITAAEDLRIIDLATKAFIGNIKSIGYPDSLKIACDPWLLDWVTQANIDLTVVGAGGILGSGIIPGGGLMNSILLKLIPTPVAMKYGLDKLQERFHLQYKGEK